MENRDLKAYAAGMVQKLDDQGFQARLFGGIAINLLIDYEKLFRCIRKTKDIDLVVALHSHRDVWKYLQEIGWQQNKRELFTGLSRKATLWHPLLLLHLDLYSAPLIFNHKIDLAGRLGLASPTLTPADLLLTKLQIHSLTEPDVRDIVALLHGLPMEQTDEQHSINPTRIGIACASDWGLYHTCNSNLQMVLHWASTRHDVPLASVRQSVEQLVLTLAKVHKGLNWRIRSRIGTKLRWYLDVD